MDTLVDMVNLHTTKNDRKIKQICRPLEILGITTFGYYAISADGTYGNIGNYPSELEHFYSENFHYEMNVLKHPSLNISGYAFINTSSNNQTVEIIEQRFDVSHFFVILKTSDTFSEGFIFSAKSKSKYDSCCYFIKNVALLNEFGCFFKREATNLIKPMLDGQYNLNNELGSSFFTKDKANPFSKNPKQEQFSKLLSPLSARERECLDLYKKGYTAQNTAAILNISQRTVEHYFDNIKIKLGCFSKRNLLEYQ